MRSTSVFNSITSVRIAAERDFEPIVLISRTISCVMKSSFFPAGSRPSIAFCIWSR